MDLVCDAYGSGDKCSEVQTGQQSRDGLYCRQVRSEAHMGSMGSISDFSSLYTLPGHLMRLSGMTPAPDISAYDYPLGRTGKISAPSELPTPPNGTHFSRAESHFILLHYEYDYPKDEGDANRKDEANEACEEDRKRDDKGTNEQQPERTGLSFEEM
ncbi:MAG: hypothetical protein Q9184_003535 [Pyrenodesmia sp. 2 TL-2023]